MNGQEQIKRKEIIKKTTRNFKNGKPAGVNGIIAEMFMKERL